MGSNNTITWLRDNGFLDENQESVKDSNNNILKNVYHIKTNPNDPESEKAVAYVEDFSYIVTEKNGKKSSLQEEKIDVHSPLLQGSKDNKRVDELTAAFNYANIKGLKFFFISKAYKSDESYQWGEKIIISFEFRSTFISSAIRFKPCFDDINKNHINLQNNEPDFDMKRYNLNYECYAAVINVSGGASHLLSYLTTFDTRAYKNNCHIIRIPVVDETPNKNTSIGDFPYNLLVYGAPGTGKSYLINEKLRDYKFDKVAELESKMQNNASGKEINEVNKSISEFKNETYYTRVTFYEDYTYDAFIGCYKPRPTEATDTANKENNNSEKWNIKSNRITYEFVPGPFVNMLVKALNNPDNKYFIVIEELNRANAAGVFGDMFQLLDRADNGQSIYHITPNYELNEYLEKHLDEFNGKIKIPCNLYIWATMNSADQGVFPIDSAFKRRWSFYYMDLNSPWDVTISLPEGTYTWESIRNAINEKILSNDGIDEDRCIGSHFFSETEIKQINSYNNQSNNFKINPFVDKLISYLRQDVFRHNPEFMFKKDENMASLSMSEIRKHFNSGSILDIFNIDQSRFEQKKAEASELVKQ